MTSDVFRRALILTGPTGSGKSRLALELAPALNAEIICMDSMTLYRGMDIGTAKPTAEERIQIPHHLLDLLEPHESASVSWWLDLATEAAQEIESRGKRVLFVGGTALYLKVVLSGLFDGPPADAQLRADLEAQAQQHGNQALHDRLAAVDRVSAARLHPNDVRRVVRALEVHTLTGRPISEWQTQWANLSPAGDERVDEDRCLCLDLPREQLYERIDARVLDMIERGLVEEVRRLRHAERPLSREASQALGYKELFAYLDGAGSLEEAILQIQTRSRNFAKRQLTWFRHLKECKIVTERLTRELWSRKIERTVEAATENALPLSPPG